MRKIAGATKNSNCFMNLNMTNDISLSSCFVYNSSMLSIFGCSSDMFLLLLFANIQTLPLRPLKTSQGCRSERDERL